MVDLCALKRRGDDYFFTTGNDYDMFCACIEGLLDDNNITDRGHELLYNILDYVTNSGCITTKQKQVVANIMKGNWYFRPVISAGYGSWLEGYYDEGFTQMLNTLDGVPGLYSFSDGKEVIYIGKSKNLRGRIPKSLQDRVGSYGATGYQETISQYTFYVNTAIIGSRSDLGVLEAYYIAKLKPTLNKDLKYHDECTIKIQENHWGSEWVKCFDSSKIRDFLNVNSIHEGKALI